MAELVGVLGLGVMGSAMAKNLIAEGFEVIGFDPVPAALTRFVGFGGTAAASPAEVAERCQTVVLSLPTTQALAEAVGGASGLVSATARGTIAIECSTLPLEAKIAARDALAATGKTLLDCPVSGTGAQAAVKDLVLFASGDRDAFDKARPVFAGFTRVQRYLGDFGNGSIMKYVANHLVTIHNVAAAEAMVLGMKAGLDPAVLYETLADSGGSSRVFQVRGPLMRDASYDVATATIRTHLKDLSIIGAFANALECPVSLFAAAAQTYYAGAAQGRENQDTASVCAVLEEQAGVVRRAQVPAASDGRAAVG